jgi:hypothetical protein
MSLKDDGGNLIIKTKNSEDEVLTFNGDRYGFYEGTDASYSAGDLISYRLINLLESMNWVDQDQTFLYHDRSNAIIKSAQIIKHGLDDHGTKTLIGSIAIASSTREVSRQIKKIK